MSVVVCSDESREELTRAVVHQGIPRPERRDHGDSFSSVVGAQRGVLDVATLHHNAVSDSRSASLLDGAVSALQEEGERVSVDASTEKQSSSLP